MKRNKKKNIAERGGGDMAHALTQGADSGHIRACRSTDNTWSATISALLIEMQVIQD